MILESVDWTRLFVPGNGPFQPQIQYGRARNKHRLAEVLGKIASARRSANAVFKKKLGDKILEWEEDCLRVGGALEITQGEWSFDWTAERFAEKLKFYIDAAREIANAKPYDSSLDYSIGAFTSSGRSALGSGEILREELNEAAHAVFKATFLSVKPEIRTAVPVAFYVPGRDIPNNGKPSEKPTEDIGVMAWLMVELLPFDMSKSETENAGSNDLSICSCHPRSALAYEFEDTLVASIATAWQAARAQCGKGKAFMARWSIYPWRQMESFPAETNYHFSQESLGAAAARAFEGLLQNRKVDPGLLVTALVARQKDTFTMEEVTGVKAKVKALCAEVRRDAVNFAKAQERVPVPRLFSDQLRPRVLVDRVAVAGENNYNEAEAAIKESDISSIDVRRIDLQ